MFTLVVLWGNVVSRGVDLGGDFLVGKCEVANAMGGRGPPPPGGPSRLSKVHQGGVQRQARPSGTSGSGPLRICQTDRCAWLGKGSGHGLAWGSGENDSHSWPMAD